MLGISLKKCIENVEQNKGLLLNEIPAGACVEVETEYSTYFIVPIDQEKGLIVLQGNGSHFRNATRCYLNGSTWGGSTIRSEWIGVGMYLEVRNPAGGAHKIVTTSMVRKITVRSDPEIVEVLKRTATARKSCDDS